MRAGLWYNRRVVSCVYDALCVKQRSGLQKTGVFHEVKCVRGYIVEVCYKSV